MDYTAVKAWIILFVCMMSAGQCSDFQSPNLNGEITLMVGHSGDTGLFVPCTDCTCIGELYDSGGEIVKSNIYFRHEGAGKYVTYADSSIYMLGQQYELLYDCSDSGDMRYTSCIDVFVTESSTTPTSEAGIFQSIYNMLSDIYNLVKEGLINPLGVLDRVYNGLSKAVGSLFGWIITLINFIVGVVGMIFRFIASPIDFIKDEAIPYMFSLFKGVVLAFFIVFFVLEFTLIVHALGEPDFFKCIKKIFDYNMRVAEYLGKIFSAFLYVFREIIGFVSGLLSAIFNLIPL